jgi:hypothetical protein
MISIEVMVIFYLAKSWTSGDAFMISVGRSSWIEWSIFVRYVQEKKSFILAAKIILRSSVTAGPTFTQISGFIRG